MTASNDQQKKFISIMGSIFSAEEDDMSCDDCFEYIDQYVEMLNAGASPQGVLKQVEHHLEQCHCCKTEMKALISIIKHMEE